ncbi:type VI secretion system baseplate subunit TssG [Paracraurococcus ruber]|uniref:Type VI secretion system baseplate subunit TssG n=1 Tax=Paracraurococcus ruber TaxID=77675 RepID=A0ABS1D4W4_9PROT|nr:type VI secretion system baseplate subunit TssG [Paracraurococcus ruber]MBK1660904.1 hypothetical protein [Paracraurococcus ruber]TDG28739.1 type VI secretion system baseplate subunit TssG [Paracraurococcus ruber]
MATAHRRRPARLSEALAAGGGDLLQVAALLDGFGRRDGRLPMGEAPSPAREAFRYQAQAHLRFPPAEVDRVAWDAVPRLLSSAFGLLGHHGPLPDWITEELAQRLRRGDRAAQEFLGVFEHRLFALRVRAQARLRPGQAGLAAADGPAGRIVFALLGLGLPALRGRMDLPDAALLPHAGLLLGRSRSAAALQAVLRRQFGVPVAVRPFQGRWLRLAPADRTRIGATGRHRALGGGALLGGRAWDAASRFAVVLGPLTLPQHLALLPGGAAHAALRALIRFHKTEDLDVVLALMLRQDAVPPLRLSTRPGDAARLGWTSILRGRPRGPVTVRLGGGPGA